MARNLFDLPDNGAMVDDRAMVTTGWLQWFSRVHNAVLSLYGSTVTADRPTAVLWVGRMHFDTTLGHPIWVQSVRPTVWVDSTGAPV